MAKSSSFSIVPDSLINVGTAFGIVLGLAVGLMSGMMMITETPTTTQTTTKVVSRGSAQDTTVGGVRTLLVQRASLVATSMRLQVNGQNADQVQQLLRGNSNQITSSISYLTNRNAAKAFSDALDSEAQRAINLAIQIKTDNTPNITAAQADLTANTLKLQTALLAISSGAAKDAQPVIVQHANAVKNLAQTVGKSQTYQAESSLVKTFDEIATYIQNYRR